MLEADGETKWDSMFPASITDRSEMMWKCSYWNIRSTRFLALLYQIFILSISWSSVGFEVDEDDYVLTGFDAM
jgi:hypothetical protein